MSCIVLALIDGLAPAALAQTNCPRIERMIANGATTLRAQSVMPSITLPCILSTFHSVPPSRHGIVTNLWTPYVRPIPGLFDVAHEAGLRTASVYNWEPLRDVARPGSLTWSLYYDNLDDTEGDVRLAETTAQIITQKPVDLLFLYLGAVDIAGHDHGWMTDAYLRQVEIADRALGLVQHALPSDTTFLVTSDHGGHERAHGLDTPEDMTIPWILSGPTVRRGHTVTQAVTLLDTAPTLAHMLGVKAHSDWEGTVVTEALQSA